MFVQPALEVSNEVPRDTSVETALGAAHRQNQQHKSQKEVMMHMVNIGLWILWARP